MTSRANDRWANDRRANDRRANDLEAFEAHFICLIKFYANDTDRKNLHQVNKLGIFL